MATYTLSPAPWQTFFSAFGILAANGRADWFVAGSTTPAVVYKDNAGTPWGTSVTLDAVGEATIYLQVGQSYKVAVYDSLGNLVRPAQDNILAVPDQSTTTVTSSLDFIQIDCFCT